VEGNTMRIMIASDIHGRVEPCKRLLELFEQEKADKLLLLGDLLYHGPRNGIPSGYDPTEVIDLLNGMKDKIWAVRGNCDAEVDQMVLDFSITADYMNFMSGDVEIFATHGHLYNPQNPPKGLNEGAILVTGHTHVTCDKIIPEEVTHKSFRYMNPGSVSLPKENTTPSYIIVDDGKVCMKPLN